MAMMSQFKDRSNPEVPPAIASDGNDSYPEAMLETWGKLPEYFRDSTENKLHCLILL